MNRVRSWSRALSAACVFLFASLLFAQSDLSQITGTVTDPTGAAVSGAKITVRNEATGLTRETVSGSEGTYTFPSLPSGNYTITVEASGFKRYSSPTNKLDANLPLSINPVLAVGAVTETVEVTAAAQQIQTESGALGRLVEGKQLSDLNINGRNPIFLAQLKPGVRGGALSGFNFALGTGGFNINGARSQDNLITFDGAVGIRTRSNGESIGTADLDSVQEVQVLTADYSAEYGRSSGGQIRVVTKSGTRDFHGALYEYFRNDALDANTWNRNRNPATAFVAPFKFNQYGWNLNGPVFIPKVWNSDRSKVFFFVGQEWAKRRTVQYLTRTVPTAAMRQGDFSELLRPNIFFNQTYTVVDPLNGQPFPGNVIPRNRLSPNGVALLNVYPLPTPGFIQGRANWYAQASAPTDQRKDTYALDVIPNQKDSVKFRMAFFHYFDINPSQTNFLFSDRFIDRPNQTASLNWTRVINPTTVNETLITASRDQVFIGMTDSPAFDRATYGINYPYLFTGKDRPSKLPALDITGFDTYTGSPYPSSSKGPIYVISNNTTKIINTHSLKFGVLFERAGQNDYDQINIQGVPGGTDNQNGRFEFRDRTTNGVTTPAIANAALGLFNNYAEIGRRSYTPYRGHMLEWFVQDRWKATSKLTFDLGLRHSIIQPYYSLWGNMTVFDPRYYDPSKAVKVDPSTGNPIPGTGDPYNGIVIPGSGWPDAAKGRVPIADSGEFNRLFRGEPKQYSNMHFKDFQPRIGIAYSLNPKTVVRTGIGRFFTRVGVSDSVFLGGNPPLQPIAAIPNGSADNPGGGSAASFPLSVNTQDKIFRNPEAWNWNFTVERELGFNTVFEASYVGRRGLGLQRERDINQPAVGAAFANPGVNINALRPYAGYGPIRLTNNEGRSLYNALQLGLNRRFSKGLSFGFSYTWSKSMDNGSTQRTVLPIAYDDSYMWGPSNFDTRHIVVVNYIYELPFFRNNNLTGKLLGGWQISGISQFQTGTPFSIATNDVFSGVGSSGNEVSGDTAGNSFWNVNGTARLDGKQTFDPNPNDSDKLYYFATTNPDGSRIFTIPANGTYVKQRVRNIFYRPGFQNWNIGLFKTFRATERSFLQFRAEAFNFLNHPNWSAPDTNPVNSTFGQVTNKDASQPNRNLQLSLRFNF